MALTEAQEKELLEGLTSVKTQLASVSTKSTELETLVKAKDAEIAELKKGHQVLTQEGQFNSLKSKYPDVPETVLKSLPEAQRDTLAKELQEKFSNVKVGPQPIKTDPMNSWADAGGIGPVDETERAAAHAEAQKRYNAAKESGSPDAVLKMLQLRSAEIAGAVRKAFAPAKA